MKKIFIICFWFLLMTNVTGQTDNYTTMKIIKTYHTKVVLPKSNSGVFEDMVFDIHLLADNKYVFSMWLSYGNLSAVSTMSQGKYNMTKKQLILNDDVFGYKLIFDMEGKNLIAKIIYSGLVGYKFTELKYYEETTYFDINQKSFVALKEMNKTKNSTHNVLYYGFYNGLQLIKPNQYIDKIFNFVFSKGTFKYNAKTNELELFDPVLNSVWALYFIEEKRLINSQGGVSFHESVPEKEIIKYVNEHMRKE